MSLAKGSRQGRSFYFQSDLHEEMGRRKVQITAPLSSQGEGLSWDSDSLDLSVLVVGRASWLKVALARLDIVSRLTVL